jgi:DNA-directed RNA polymerase specialized sigma24 family protein
MDTHPLKNAPMWEDNAKLIRLYNMILRLFYTNDPDDVRDSFWRALANLQKEYDKAAEWLFTEEQIIRKLYVYVKNLLIDLYRRRSTATKTESEYAGICDAPPPLYEGLQAEVAMEVLFKFLNDHPSKKAKVIKAFLLGTDEKTILEVFKIKHKTFIDYMSEFRKQLITFLKSPRAFD